MGSPFRAGLSLAVLALAALPLHRAGAQLPTVEQIVARHLEARGGAAALAALSTMKLTGTIEAGGRQLPVTLTKRRPNHLCQEIEVQGTIVRSVFDGRQAWTINPMLGSSEPRALDGFPAEALRDQAMFGGPLAGYREAGGTLAVEGTEKVAGAPAWKLKLTYPDGRALYIFVDVATALVTRLMATYEQDGQPLVMETLLSDYAPVNGVQVARTRRAIIGGQRQGRVQLTSIELNVAVDETLFTMSTGH